MEKLQQIESVVAHLALDNVDTDMIIPKQFLKTIKRTGLGKNLFHEMRYDLDGNLITDFVLNQDQYKNAKILLSGKNFGCGSSREHAPWALVDFGIRVVIANSYADIFFNNCFKNSILPVILEQEQTDKIASYIASNPQAIISVDLPSQTIKSADGEININFSIDDFRKKCLVEGLDDISLTLQDVDKISAFEETQKSSKAWLYPNS